MKNSATEKSYGLKRITGTLERKEKDLRRKHTHKTKPLTVKAKLEAIRNGEASLKWRARMDMTLEEAFDYNDVENGNVLDDVFYAEWAKVEKEGNNIKDLIMLGDAEQSLALIQKFDK